MNKDKSVNELMAELEKKMDWFNSDEFTLDEAGARYAEVEKLADKIEKILLTMQNDVEVIKKKFD